MAGGITNGFDFKHGGQVPSFALGSLVTVLEPALGGFAKKIIIDEANKKAEDKRISSFLSATDYPSYDDEVATKYSSGASNTLYKQKKLGAPEYAVGGLANMPQYAQGGQPRFLSGGGDGMSDSIKATIDGHQEARLADGEFVIPADVVSHLGNGSSKAGAKQLHSMMDRIRKARTGNPKQGKQINPMKFMPA
jgi:hypothetical protein